MARRIPAASMLLLRAAALGLLALAAASGAGAATIVSITGQGSLQIDVSGDLYFDTGDLELTDLTLEAASSISFGPVFPASFPSSFDQSLEIYDAQDLIGLAIDDDAYFESFAWSGSVSLGAANIYATGSLEASGPIDLSAGPGEGPTGGTGGCSGGGGITLTSGSGEAICVPGGELTIGPGGIDVSPGGVGPVVTPAIPEPTAALLFAVGAGAVATALRGGRARLR